jgi:hypothetical protein
MSNCHDMSTGDGQLEVPFLHQGEPENFRSHPKVTAAKALFDCNLPDACRTEQKIIFRILESDGRGLSGSERCSRFIRQS